MNGVRNIVRLGGYACTAAGFVMTLLGTATVARGEGDDYAYPRDCNVSCLCSDDHTKCNNANGQPDKGCNDKCQCKDYGGSAGWTCLT